MTIKEIESSSNEELLELLEYYHVESTKAANGLSRKSETKFNKCADRIKAEILRRMK